MTQDPWSYELVPLPDGRTLEVLAYGEGDRALLSFTGTPGGAVPNEALAEEATKHGLRLLQPLRPGYGQSSPRPGRRIVDFAEDVEAALKHVGIDEAVCMGGSGGGPHALAMAARLPQCRAALVHVSPAPRDAADLDFYEGMGLSNQEEWRLADEGEAAVRPWLEKAVADMHPEDGSDSFAAMFGDALSDEDRAFLEAGAGAIFMASFAKAVETGIEGWLEDDIALVTPWGFDLETITTPVTFWTGKQDQFVSWWHTVWMAQRVPGADLHVLAGEGHMSLRQHHLPAMVQDLLTRAGW
jgi:pimeloyl-ACP methyl ester carboxylesterase